METVRLKGKQKYRVVTSALWNIAVSKFDELKAALLVRENLFCQSTAKARLIRATCPQDLVASLFTYGTLAFHIFLQEFLAEHNLLPVDENFIKAAQLLRRLQDKESSVDDV